MAHIPVAVRQSAGIQLLCLTAARSEDGGPQQLHTNCLPGQLRLDNANGNCCLAESRSSVISTYCEELTEVLANRHAYHFNKQTNKQTA